MKLFQRFAYYGMGLLIGSVFVYFIWEKKDVVFNYLPNARVLSKIQRDTHLFSDDAIQSMKEIGIDSLSIEEILKFGDVSFRDSDTKSRPCRTFVIDGKPEGKSIRIFVKACDSISTIDRVILNEK